MQLKAKMERGRVIVMWSLNVVKPSSISRLKLIKGFVKLYYVMLFLRNVYFKYVSRAEILIFLQLCSALSAVKDRAGRKENITTVFLKGSK